MALIIGFIFTATYLVSPVEAATAYDLTTFDNTSDLTGKFNPDSTPYFTNASSGGINDSGAVSVPINNNDGDIWTTKQGFSVPGTGEKYAISALIKFDGGSGYGSLGFSNIDANETDLYGSPATGIGIVFHGGGGYFVNNRSNTSQDWPADLDLDGGYLNHWYKMILEVTAKGGNAYDLKFQIWDSDANGTLGEMRTENILNGVVNADIGGASEMYGYFSARGANRVRTIDNFLIESEGGAEVSTSSITDITNVSATSGGNVTDEQGSTVTAKGVCWSTSTSPTISNDCTNDGSGLGVFTSNLTGLAVGTTYYVRAYATNSSGTSYGSEYSFTTSANSTSSNNSSSGSSSNPSAPSCGDSKPFGSPDLFQIDVNDTHATLYYTPLNNNISDYFISYSEISNTFRYGTLTGQGPSSGVLSYTVNFLQPNTTYYFKVRGQNGCMPGDFGNELKITTRAKGLTTLLPYYRYFTNLQGILEPNP